MTTAIRHLPNIIIIALGLGAAALGLGYGVLGDDGRIGPGFLPTLCGVLMALFALINFFNSRPEEATTLEGLIEDEAVSDAAELEAPSATSADGTDIYGRSQRQRDRMLWAVVGIILATVILIPLLGFILAFAVMLVVIAVVVERRRILPSLMVSVITLAVTYAIFVIFLQVPLPQGFLGF